MTNKQLERVMRLIKKTNDKAIVLDQASDEVVVMLPLDKYEDMLDGSELGNDNFDGPNFDTAVMPEMDEEWEKEQILAAADENSVKEKSADVELNFEGWNEEKNESKKDEVSLSDVPHEEEEEKFYLEPIE